MKKLIQLLFLAIVAGPLFSQTIKYELAWVDSLKKKMVVRSTITNPDGSIKTDQSIQEDSAASVDRYILIMDNRKNAFENDFQLLDSGLIKSIGVGYDVLKKGKVAAEIAGNWIVLNDPQELLISVSPDLKVMGGTIKGSITVIDKDTIEIKGVLPKTFTVKKHDRLKWIGQYDGKQVLMNRPAEFKR